MASSSSSSSKGQASGSTAGLAAGVLLEARLHRLVASDCAFAQDCLHMTVRQGQTLWLTGPSGAGKTLTCLQVCHTSFVPLIPHGLR